jgi:hypothetical protein
MRITYLVFACAICASAQPRPILETGFQNPAHSTSTPHWASDVCGGHKYFVNASPPYEWMQVLHPASEQDDEIVGASGVAITPKLSGGDVPFTHPFGFDWEFFMALDPPYNSLLAPGNVGPDGEFVEAARRSAALGLNARNGTLGLETDRDLVPPAYRVREGDRVAAFGRWIVDCGHTDFHTEIHPPLLLVAARRDGRATSVSVISRPWLVGQRFTVDDEPIRGHLANEVIKVETLRSARVEAHPKILKPFSGVQRIEYIVRPPDARHAGRDRLTVSFHFTVRHGVTVQVANAGADAIRVSITMDADAYKVAPLPRRNDWEVSLSQMSRETDLLNKIQLVNIFGHPVAAILLQRDWLTDRYDAPQHSAYDSNVTKMAAAGLPAATPFRVDDSQPFPIYG